MRLFLFALVGLTATSAIAQPPPPPPNAPSEVEAEAEAEAEAEVEAEAEAELEAEAQEDPERQTEGDVEVQAAEDPPREAAVVSPLESPEETETAATPRQVAEETIRNEILALDQAHDHAARWDIASHSEGKHYLSWGEGWSHFGLLDYIIVGTTLALTVAGQVIGPINNNPRDAWTSQTAFDREVREHVRRSSDRERENMKDASDIILSLLVSWPFLFDGLMTALWYHDEPEIGRELALMAVEVQFVSASLQGLANISSRERPYGDICGAPGEQPDDALPEDDGACTGRVRYRSFFSGHTSQSFAAAATTCMFHARLPLYGGGSPDVLACGVAMGLAAAVGMFRVMADVHHITDVIMGAAVGTAVGIALPAFRMRNWGTDRDPDERTVRLVPNGLGLALIGELR